MRPTARWLVGALVLSAPSLIALAVLADRGSLAARPALVAGIAVYCGVLLLLRPLTMGIAEVQARVDAMAAGEPNARDVVTLSPSVRELWLAVARWGRASRQRLSAREAELGAAQAILAALPDPLILLDERR